MKRVISMMLLLSWILCGCASDSHPVTRDEIVSAYSEAGYTVSSEVYDEPLTYGEIAYIQADHPDGGYIYFRLFETEAQAKANKDAFHHPVVIGLFSWIYGEASWLRCRVHGNIVVQYDDPVFYAVFEELLNSK